jgi:transcriptional regulator with XRE-family HTH domain
MTQVSKRKAADGTPMKLTGKRYASVTDLVRDTTDAAFAEEFEKHLAGRRLVRALAVLRGARGLSQAELAAKLGCGQPKISKMESSVDADLNFGDVVRYVDAMDRTLLITLTPPIHTGRERIRYHVACIQRALEELERLAGDDKSSSMGIGRFAIKTVANLTRMIEQSIGNLPHRVEQKGLPVCVEVVGGGAEEIDLTTEDEAILDEVWDRGRAEKKRAKADRPDKS